MFPTIGRGVHMDMSEVDGDVFDIGTGNQFEQGPIPDKSRSTAEYIPVGG